MAARILAALLLAATASVARAAVAERPRAVVCFDAAHNNQQTLERGYLAFGELLEEEGLAVSALEGPFGGQALERCSLLVVVNARGPAAPADPAFAEPELEVVEAWVGEQGGALLLIADHAPFGSAARALAERFGVRMWGGHVRDEVLAEPGLGSPYILEFTRDAGRIGDHPVTRGRESGESVERVITFGGQALTRIGGEGTDLLLLTAGALSVANPRDPDAASGARTVPHGAAAVAIEHGAGRVVVLGEAAMATEQVFSGPAARQFGRKELRVGLSYGDSDNRQFVLNVIRWLLASG